MPTAFDVADYLMAKFQGDPELFDDCMTNLKLQKLVYYSQGFSLALLGEPLFPEPLEAREHGPACRKLYDQYKACGQSSIATDISLEEAMRPFTEDQIEVMDSVHAMYGGLSASQLRHMSQRDDAWKDARKNASDEIGLEALKRSCSEHLTFRAIRIILTAEELEAIKREADELGLPDSLEGLEA
jgi:uncharacterized phage-associated protein